MSIIVIIIIALILCLIAKALTRPKGGSVPYDTGTGGERFVAKQYAFEQGRCPRCGSQLVVRNGKYGAFYGCTNYPRCKFTQDL